MAKVSLQIIENYNENFVKCLRIYQTTICKSVKNSISIITLVIDTVHMYLIKLYFKLTK